MADNSQKDPEVWVDEYGDILYRYAVARVRDPAIAEILYKTLFSQALKDVINSQGVLPNALGWLAF